MGLRKWGTLLELKKDHPKIGLKGWIFFIVDFPMNIDTGKLEYVLAQPTFTGLGVSTGISSYVLKKEQVEQLFTVLEQTFNEYAKEMEDEYFENRKKENRNGDE